MLLMQTNLIQKRECLYGGVEAHDVYKFVHGLHLLVKLLPLDGGEGKRPVDPREQRGHQLRVHLPLGDAQLEEREVDSNQLPR